MELEIPVKSGRTEFSRTTTFPQPIASTFKFFFNGIYLGGAESMQLGSPTTDNMN
jgi:hypothetical protein